MPEKYSDVLADWLVELGYTHCFFVAGGNIMHLLDSCRQRFACVATVHEVAAGIAAEYFNAVEGEGRAFALVTAGPGLTNIVTALGGAWLESRELLVLGGQVKASDLAARRGPPARHPGGRRDRRRLAALRGDAADRAAGAAGRRRARDPPRHDAPQGPGLPRGLPRRPGRARSSVASSRATRPSPSRRRRQPRTTQVAQVRAPARGRRAARAADRRRRLARRGDRSTARTSTGAASRP